MTNEQTTIFLKSLRQRVQLAIKKTEAAMPVDAPKERRWRHKSSIVSFPFLDACLCTRTLKPDHWEEVDGVFVATAHLEELLESLDEDIDLLKESVKENAA